MRKFQDSSGRTWDLTVTLGVQQEIYAAEKVDIRSPQMWERFASDPNFRWTIILTICEEQAKALGLTMVEVSKSLTPDDIDGMEENATEALIDFFPSSQRQKIRELSDGLKSLATTKAPKVSQAIQAVVSQMEAEFDKSLESLLSGTSTGSTSGNAPAQSA